MSFWDTLRDTVEVISRVMPPCHVCGAPGAQICMVCQQVSCHRHSYLNIGSARSVCSSCLSEAFSWAADDYQMDGDINWPYDESPWAVLNVGPDACRDEINKAHREASKIFHPDCGGSTEQQIKINRAKEVMLKRAA